MRSGKWSQNFKMLLKCTYIDPQGISLIPIESWDSQLPNGTRFMPVRGVQLHVVARSKHRKLIKKIRKSWRIFLFIYRYPHYGWLIQWYRIGSKIIIQEGIAAPNDSDGEWGCKISNVTRSRLLLNVEISRSNRCKAGNRSFLTARSWDFYVQ